MRKDPLVNGQVYHIMNKSIAGFEIFHRDDYIRILQTLNYYKKNKPPCMLSTFNKLSTKEQLLIQKKLNETNNIVEIISYCVMPTHLHLVLKQLIDGGISEYMKRVCDSYSKYFNLKYKRKGPLWEGRFKSVLVDDDKQLLHLTRYVHLNPISAGLVDDPMDWMASSYKEYINASRTEICNFNDLINISPNRYRRFVNERISYQRVIAHIKHIILE